MTPNRKVVNGKKKCKECGHDLKNHRPYEKDCGTYKHMDVGCDECEEWHAIYD